MGMRDSLFVEGSVIVRLNGEEISKGHNMVVDPGLDMFAGVFGSATWSRPGWMAIASSAVGTTSDMVALQGAEHIRVAIGTAITDNVIAYSATFGTQLATTMIHVAEIGIFNASASGAMLSRFTLTEVDMNNLDSLAIEWQLTVNPRAAT